MHSQRSKTDQLTTTDRLWWDTFNAVARASLNGDAKAVLIALLSYANGPGHECPLGNSRPGVRRLMEHTGLGRSTVLRKLAELTEIGWLEVTAQGGGAAATTYCVTTPAEQTRPASGTPPVPLAGPPPSRWRDPTDSVPTQDRRNRFTAAAPRGAGSSSAGEGDRVPGAVLDAVQVYAGGDRWDMDAVERFEAAVAPVYGREVAEWITAGPVHFAAGLSRYEVGARVRQVLATARAQGVGVLRMPAARNTVDVDSPDSRAIQAAIAESLAQAQPQEPAYGPESPRDAPECLEPLLGREKPAQAPAVAGPGDDPHEQITRMADYVARYEARDRQQRAESERLARWAERA